MTGRNAWRVTFEVITQESATHGDAESRGFIDRNGDDVDVNAPDVGMTFKEAMALFSDADCNGGVESNEYPVSAPRWFTAYGSMDVHDGSNRNVSIHLPDNITPASRLRIARLVDCYGVPKL